MTFVPPPTFVPPRQASLEAQDLAREIENTIVDFQKRRPRTGLGDVRQAMSIVEMRAGVGGASRQRPAMIIALLIGLLGALVLGIVMFAAAR
ncbi:MAG: hypothetical protein AMS18_04950 [Gemmatimonas sp. SG8_17]|nr:MAG: hypothetical protein AMS18_04950 [Gemmatimonas sp. SG8_17]